MKLDRKLQFEILKTLADKYPGTANSAVSSSIFNMADEDAVIANLIYLDEHGLIASGLRRSADGRFAISTGNLKITASGMDFITDDGGLSAILGVVTIKIHDDQLRLLLASRIQESDMPEEEKRKWLDQLREIPLEATKHLAHKLIDAGLSQWPVVLAAMQTLVK